MHDIQKLLEIMKTLRDADKGCPWDAEQNFATIAPFTVEEAYEVADAIARDDMPALRGELGDLLFQVVFHAQMASEAGEFDFGDVVNAISEKMIRRHPHVFGSAEERSVGNAARSWERIKADERADSDDQSAVADVARALPALKRAQKLGERASIVGFDWDDRTGVRDKIHEELEELEEAVGSRETSQIDEEFGDLLFAVVNLARHLKVDAEQALSCANDKFERRFREMERAIKGSGRVLGKLSLAELEQEWRAAKRRLS